VRSLRTEEDVSGATKSVQRFGGRFESSQPHQAVGQLRRFPGGSRIAPNWQAFVRSLSLYNWPIGFRYPFRCFCLWPRKSRFPATETVDRSVIRLPPERESGTSSGMTIVDTRRQVMTQPPTGDIATRTAHLLMQAVFRSMSAISPTAAQERAASVSGWPHHSNAGVT
jgi:hypothetical protein